MRKKEQVYHSITVLVIVGSAPAEVKSFAISKWPKSAAA